MRKVALALSLFFTVTFAGSALADCTSAPVFLRIGNGYWNYTHNPLDTNSYECWSKDPGINWETPNSCNSGGWSFEAFSQTLSQSLTVGTNDQGGSGWQLGWHLDFSSPQASGWDVLQVTVSVLHNGQYTNYRYSHNGTQGDMTCGIPYINFTAQNGDTISITFTGSRGNTDAKIQIWGVSILRNAA